MPEVEAAYKSLVEQHEQQAKRKPCGKVQVLKFMIERPNRIWWYSWQLIGGSTSDGEYLSHRAPARASDLANKYPELVEDRKIGRFSVYRLRTENLGQVQEFIKTNK